MELLPMIQQYYLTEMNTLKLENVILKFIHHQQLKPLLINGIVAKVSAMMYNLNIDYYYADEIATATDTDIKFVNNVYIHGYKYTESLSNLLSNCKEYQGASADAEKLENDINKILETKRRIRLKKPEYN